MDSKMKRYMDDYMPQCMLNMIKCNARFNAYDVVYDSFEQIDELKRKSQMHGVTLTSPMDIESEHESCEGMLGDCIMYLKDYLESDHGYQGAMALDILDEFTDEDFTKFCIWLNEWLTDWIVGIKHNDKMKMHFIENHSLDEADMVVDWLDANVDDMTGEWIEGLPLELFLNPSDGIKHLLRSLKFELVDERGPNGMPIVKVTGDKEDVAWFDKQSTTGVHDRRWQDVLDYCQSYLLRV